MSGKQENFFDTHCHIDKNAPSAPGFSGAGRLLCGLGTEDWAAVRDAAAAWRGTVAAYGVHPWRVAETTSVSDFSWLAGLENFLARDAGAWVGEIGLDAARTGGGADKALQEEVFRRQVDVAARLGRRINVHCVRAWDSLVRILGGWRGEFIVHSFSGPFQYIDSLTDMGAYFSVGPRVSEERAKRLPPDRILLESDSFLAPGRDAVEDLEKTFEWLAGVRGVDESTLAGVIRENTGRLFGSGYQHHQERDARTRM